MKTKKELKEEIEELKKQLVDQRASIIEEMRKKHPKGFCYICGKGGVGIHHLRNMRTKGKGTITGEIPLCRCCHDAVEQTKKFKKLKDAYNNGKEKRNAEVKRAIEWYYNDLQEAIDKTHDMEKYEITDGEMAKIVMEKGQLLLKELLQKLGLEK